MEAVRPPAHGRSRPTKRPPAEEGEDLGTLTLMTGSTKHVSSPPDTAAPKGAARTQSPRAEREGGSSDRPFGS